MLANPLEDEGKFGQEIYSLGTIYWVNNSFSGKIPYELNFFFSGSWENISFDFFLLIIKWYY